MSAAAARAAVVVTDYTTLAAFQTAAGTVQAFGFGGLMASSGTTYNSIEYDDMNFAPDTTFTTLKVLNGNNTYGKNVKFLDASVLKDTSSGGTGKDDQILITYPTSGVTGAAFEIGTATTTSGANIAVTVDYTKISNGNIGSKSFAPMISSPTAGEYFVGYTAAPGYEITSIDIEEKGTKNKGTALDLLQGFTTAALPEPSTWALMILGGGLIGGALRRKAASTIAA
jgi:hypothetical protein